jgi:hypothetical protein
MDFVSPAIAGMLYYDLMQRFIPWPIAAWDRSRALELGWQRAFAQVPGRPFERPLEDLYRDCAGLPQLLLNSTVVETGQRAVLTRLETNPAGADPVFVDHFDAMDARYTTRSQSLAGLALHSARFPVVSPAGTVEEVERTGGRRPAFRLVDGGYYDNSGIQTAVELIGYLEQAMPDRMQPILVLVRNAADPPESAGSDAPGASRWFPELGSIVGGLFNVRGAHAEAARKAAARLQDVRVFDLVVGDATPAARAPLGWSLSASVREALESEAGVVAARVAPELERRLRPGTDPRR